MFHDSELCIRNVENCLRSMDIDKIYLGDCLELMKEIPDKSIDCIICDLPYGVLSKNNTHAQWDRIIPFEPLWEQYERITKDNAAIILFGQGMFTAKLMMSQQKLWRYNLIWDKDRTSGFLNANRMPLRQHEDIVMFYRALPTYNPQMMKCAPHQRNHGRGSGKHVNTNNCYGKWNEIEQTISDEKYPTSIICFPKEHYSDMHPTQKPVELIRYLIRTYTNEGDLVLDNCVGSGTTAIAAIKENRHFIGMELNKEYYEIACERIKKEQAEAENSLFNM